MYALYDQKGAEVDVRDCLYDYNDMLPKPYDEPIGGDWHELDCPIEAQLKAMGYTIKEVHFMCGC